MTRGLWLIVLELTVMQLAYYFNFSASNPIFLLVLCVLGACMVVPGGAHLAADPRGWVCSALPLIALHNMLDRDRAQGSLAPLRGCGISCTRSERSSSLAGW